MKLSIRLSAAFVALFASAQTAFALCEGVDLIDEIRASDPDRYAEAEARAAKHPNAEGIFWRITKGDAPASYLFGTFHSNDDGLGDRVDAPFEAAREARLVFVEIDAAEKASMDRAFAADPAIFMASEPTPFAAYLPADLAAKAEARVAEYGVPAMVAAHMKPWFVQVLLSSPPCHVAAIQAGEQVLDQQIEAAAIEAGAQVRGLETWRDQISLFSGASLEEQREGLRLTLLTGDRPADVLETLRRLYAAERPMMIWEISMMQARMNASDMEIEPMIDAFWERAVVKRNIGMVETAAPELEKGDVLIAVGALHLGGEFGLVELLRRRGFTVDRIR